jgi:NTE family protein
MGGKALVLGGGGVAGVAWELGILAGLAEAGTDLTTADLFVGTSAGSVVAAQVASGLPLEELYERQLAGYVAEIPARMSPLTMLGFFWAYLRSRDLQRALVRIGRTALAARTVPEAERRKVVESRLPVHHWPDRRLLIAAVDAQSGEFAAFDKESGVSLVDAVAASCAVPAVWPPVTINGRRWIDGGVRSPANVDLAAGYDPVVVVAPFTRGFRSMSVANQVRALPGSPKTLVIEPDRAARQAIGRNPLDPARRAPAARAGRAQAATIDAALWSTA